MVREIAKTSSFHAYSIMTGSPQYLTILLIAKTTCVKVMIRRPLLGAPFEDLLPCPSLTTQIQGRELPRGILKNTIMPVISF